MSPIFLASEVLSSKYVVRIKKIFSPSLLIHILIGLGDHRDLPQPWTPYIVTAGHGNRNVPSRQYKVSETVLFMKKRMGFRQYY